MQPSIILPADSPLLTPDGLRPDVRLWCGERLEGGLRLLREGDECWLIFDCLGDSLAFARRWM